MRALALSFASIALVGGCTHKTTSPQDSLSAVAPDLACTGPIVSTPSGITTVTLTGSDFTPMPSRTLSNPRQLLLPQVTLVGAAALPGGTLPSNVAIADDPANPTASRLHWTSESQMGFDVNPADSLPTGVFDVTVTEPDMSRSSTLSQVLALIPPPVVTAANPMAICDVESSQTVQITGTSFLVFDGETPTVTIGSGASAHTYTATFQPSDCQPIPGTFTEQNVELCTAIEIEIPAGDFDVNVNTQFPLVVTNPPPADCASSTSFEVSLDAAPTVTSVVPSTVCAGGAQLTIDGSNFEPGATVTLQCPDVTIQAGTVVVNESGTEIAATFGGGAPANQTCNVIVQNPDGCTDLPLPHKTVSVSAGPIAFLVDPDVVYNGINTRITIYATTVSFPVTVELVQGATVTALATLPQDPQHPNRVQAIVPTGQSPGVYDIELEDNLHCPTELPSALTVTDATTVTLENLVPSFGQTGTNTSVELFRDTTAAAPNDHPFVDAPRVYLNPHGNTTQPAVALDAMTFLDQNRVTGVVPAATAVASYDVILVNPDATVGVLVNGYQEVSTAPPDITAAVPSSIVFQAGQHVQLVGTGFASSDVVSLQCETNGTSETATLAQAAPTCGATGCTQNITIDGSALAAGSVCVVLVTNPDGTTAEYSAIGVTNASFNLNSPAVGPDMNVGRRALVGASGFATGTNRFVYAIGGDAGTPAGALSSVEFAPVDPFGSIGAWTLDPIAMPAARTLGAGTTVGRYIYLAGGNDGTDAVATAVRAEILSPLETPVISDLDAKLQAQGLDPGQYHYRVSAVFAAGDTDNPSGESLASDELTVNVPSFPNQKLALTVIWQAPLDSLGTPLPNVVGYRIYRTAKNGPAGSETLLGTVSGNPAPTTFLDDGSQAPGTATPLPLGSTGNWLALPAMSTAREGLAVASGPDAATAGTFYVYAALGLDATGTGLTSYEYLTITTAPNGRQTASAAWTPGTLASSSARYQLAAWTVDDLVADPTTYPAGSTYIFFGGGLTAAGAADGVVEAGKIGPAGQLLNTTVGAGATTLDTTPKSFPASFAGYGVCAANDFLYTFGGLNAAPSKGSQKAPLASPAPSLAGSSWNNEGLQMTHGRYLLGSTVQSAFIFLLGGQTDEPSAASKTTELVIW